MEAKFATFSQSINNSSSPPPTVSDMEFYLFHNIDRVLFTRLIGNHGGRRYPKEAIQIMGFWIWLEREVVDNLTLVSQMLDFQMKLVNDLCDEAVMCLRCVASDAYPFSDRFELSLMPIFVQRKVTFRYFYENRAGVIKGVAKMVKEVCVRAFRDILDEYARGTSSTADVSQAISVGPSKTTANETQTQNTDRGKSVVQAPLHIQSKGKGKEVVYDGTNNNVAPFVMSTATTTIKENPDGVQNLAGIKPLMIPRIDGIRGGDCSFFTNKIEFGTFMNPTPLFGQPSMVVQENLHHQGGYGYWFPYYVTQPTMRTQSSGLSIDASAFTVNAAALTPPQGFPGNATAEPSEIKQDPFDSIDFSHIFKSSLTLIDEDDDSPHERTIFLTFSRGYPVSATEVKEFFTKKFGDFIESIHMQEVNEDEQVLFARVVARSPAFVDAVVEGGRAKYNINGKHVWARKYVKNKKSPPPSEGAGPSTSSFALGAMKF